MKTTEKAPQVPLKDFKRAKIVATIGPATDSYEQVLEVIQSGANGLRLNFSHGNHEEHGRRIAWIRKASASYGKPVAIIQDLQGPKIRLGDFSGSITVQKGQNLRFQYESDYERSGIIPTQYDLAQKVKRGEQMMLFDGKIRTTITSVKDGVVHVTVENNGVLMARKGINLPDTDFEGDVITAKDKRDVAYGSENDIDYVAQSFVQTAGDVRALRTILHNLGSKAKIIAKVETKAAVENLEEIVKEADAVMVARGDLAIETQPESVPVVQRQITMLGQKYCKPVIVATQMLASMTDNPQPTRAEVSDVATAVIIGADAVMLSDETASGHFPIEAVQTMKRVVRYAESHSVFKVTPVNVDEPATRQSAICRAVINLAKEIKAVAIVAETKSGATALQIAARRPEVPIIAVTSDPRVSNQLAITYGVKSYVRPDNKYAATKLTDWLSKQRVLHSGDTIVTASGKYPGVVGTTDTIKVRVIE